MRSGSSLALDRWAKPREARATTLALAEAAGEALQTLPHRAESTNAIRSLPGAEEQAQVAREVDRNLVNIRDLSVRSAAGADQTSASSHELSQLANALQGMVRRFQL